MMRRKFEVEAWDEARHGRRCVEFEGEERPLLKIAFVGRFFDSSYAGLA
jgi:hypothetical protein